MANGSGEKAWVETLLPRLLGGLQSCAAVGGCVGVEAGCRLAYANEVLRYDWKTDDLPEQTTAVNSMLTT